MTRFTRSRGGGATDRARSFSTVSPMRAHRLPALLVVVGAVLAGLVAPAVAQTAGTPPGTNAPRLRATTPVLSARRVPELLRAKIADDNLATALKPVLKEAPPTSCLVVTHHGRTVARTNGDTIVEPASTNKLLTANALLRAFPPTKVLATTAVAGAPPQNGVIAGNLWIVGGGDAMLGTTGYKLSFIEPDQPITDAAALADRIKAAGVTTIQGDIVGDDSRYDAERYISSWPNRYKREDTVGPVSALIVNDGVTGYVATPTAASKVRQAGDPPVLAADTLKTLLKERGITVTGAAVAGRAPAATTEVARLETPMQDEIAEMLSWSDNTTAESLTKELGLETARAGTTAAGLAAVRAALDADGLPTAGLVLNDGSGLDEGNRLTCDLVTALLDRHGPTSPLAQALAVAGQRGTLRKRLRGTTVDGRVLGKTGTLTQPPVVALSGFEKTHDDSTLTFAFIQNGPKSDTTIGDKMALALFSYPQAPDRAELGPTAPAPS